jgi:hypothetical protein
MKIFLRQHTRYEEKVLDHVRKKGVPREDLNLPADEVWDLLDFKVLETLRNDYLLKLKDMSHSMFRTLETTDSFDRYVTTIFHLVSILKEEHYSLKCFGPQCGITLAVESSLLEEAHQFFPRRVNRLESLFESARNRIEQLLPQQTGDRILIHSVYLYGNLLFDPFYENPLEGFYRKMYPDGGPGMGYFEAGKSFYKSGFYDLAEEALNKALKASHIPSDEEVVRTRKKEIEELLRRIRAR